MGLVPITVCLLLIFTSCCESITIAEIEKGVFDRLEIIDIDSILKNKRILTKYVRCILRVGICSPEVRDFRISLPRILKHLCKDCTPRQRLALKKIFEHVKTQRPEQWAKIMKIYDPRGEHADRVEQFIKNNNSKNNVTSNKT